MKKLFFVLALASMSLTSMAQDEPTQKFSVATNSFWNNWFVQVGADWNAYYSSQEHANGHFTANPFKSFRSNPGAAIAVGKWFTPGIGLRTKVQGIWGQTVNSDKDHPANRYWIANEQVMFNLNNMIGGYNPNRFWSFIPFLGAGIGRSMTHDIYAMNLSCGILNQFRLSEKMALNLELGWNHAENDLDGNAAIMTHKTSNTWEDKDNNLYAEVGLTFNIGKSTWEKTPDVDAIKSLYMGQIDALNGQLNDANNEIGRLRNMLDNMPEPQTTVIDNTVKEFITTPVSVFFNLDKTEIAVLKDLVNVRALAKFAKENNRSILVTGYADSATGSEKHNQWLSEKRAERVANELINMGIEPSKITTAAKGGVDILTPIDFNRRATVQITEE
jgi:outer membrane protein OmpA-like peptidoglycan-associated protein